MSTKNQSTLPLAFIFTFVVLIFGSLVVYHWQKFYQNHFFPQTFINQIDISNLSYDEALELLQAHQVNAQEQITLNALEQTISSSSAQLQFSYDFPESLTEILTEQNQKKLFTKINLFLFAPVDKNFIAHFSIDQAALKEMLAQLAAQVDQEGLAGYLQLKKSGDVNSLVIEQGQNSYSLDQESAFNFILAQLPQARSFTLAINENILQLSPVQIDNLTKKAQNLIGKKIILATDKVDNFNYSINDIGLISLLSASSSAQLQRKQEIANEIKNLTTRSPQEPELTLDMTQNTISSFTPPLDGLILDQNAFFQELDQSLNQLENSETGTRLELVLPLISQAPTKSLGQTNNLGINELIGFGESYYAHSISGRIHNVALTAAKINNTLVAPGAEFSFNRTLGDVSTATGFQPGYIIQNGRSELSPGGGVCQVSTTLFRALLDAGLKITLRLPHSYRVTYYELNNDPGFDATVYSGNIDLRFINDTDHYILISTYTNSDDLYMNVRIYGTSDGRTTAITDYKKYGATAAPATEYIVDPSMAPGTKKQIDWAVGGLKTIFTHTIYNADGSIRSQQQYPSTYQAWSAKFLVGP
ncbi:MAG: VanW family protein [bacterium]|nr:VanW family protein [bacterium]